MSATVFANCAVLDGTRTERREGHHVLVEDGLISEVSDRPIKSASAEIVDLAGRTLMPGLIDAHVHVIAVDQALARLSERPVSLVKLAGRRACSKACWRAALPRCATPAAPMPGWREAVEHGLVRGPRIFPSGQALSQTGGHGDLRPRTRSVSVVACACCEDGAGLARIADGVDECRRAARDELRKGADPDQDHGVGRRRLAVRPDLEPAIQRRRDARDRRGGAGLAHLCDGARLHRRGDPRARSIAACARSSTAT